MDVDISESSFDTSEPTEEGSLRDMGNFCVTATARVSPVEYSADAEETRRPPGWDEPEPLPDRMTDEVSIARSFL
ncbi:hypothetical protein MTO96_035062 [Rhipicephalus appendiculatus]